MRKGIIITLMLVIFWGVTLYGELAVTVYNQNMALVKDKRSFEFQTGQFEYSLTDVPSQIDPTSVKFNLLGDEDGATLLEQNYRYDLIGFNKILEKYLDKNISLIHESGDVYSGTLQAHDGGTVTLLKNDGSLEVIKTDKITKFDFPTLPEGLITKPTLVWMFDSRLNGDQEGEVSYITRGMNWHAEYVGVVSENEEMLDISAWVSIENNSGGSYNDAKLKLVAGDVNVIQKIRGGRGMEMEMAMAAPRAKADFEEKAFFEYHLYTLPRTTSLKNNEIKQIALFEPAVTPVEKKYIYPGGEDIQVNLIMTNSEQRGMGMPLPAGKFRIMKRDTDGALEFIGEDLIDHTPRDENVELFLGNAFDLVGERVVKDSRRVSQTVRDEDVEITLKNRKEDENVEILVRQQFHRRDWKIMQSNYEYEKKDVTTVEFKIPVNAGQEVKLTYTVRLGAC